MEIIIDLAKVKDAGLMVDEYLLLFYAYSKKMRQNLQFVDQYGSKECRKYLIPVLEKKGYVKVVESVVHLREKTIQLFEDTEDLFTEFFGKFPLKTPSNRYLRGGDIESIKGKNARKKWNKHFRNRPNAARKAIQALEAELAMRRRNNSLNFMHNMETWLNQGDYETYYSLVSEQKQLDQRTKEDFA